MNESTTCKDRGKLEVICGPMFSGKSEELIRRLRRAMIAKQRVIAFKHSLDNRSTVEHIASHDGRTIKAFPVDTIDGIYKQLTPDVDVIGIDEVQFFQPTIVTLVHQLVTEGKRVIIAGFERDFRGLPMGPMPFFLALADSVLKLSAICAICGKDAQFSQRLVNGKPAKYDDPTIVIGAQDCYQARCRACHVIDKPLAFDEHECT